MAGRTLGRWLCCTEVSPIRNCVSNIAKFSTFQVVFYVSTLRSPTLVHYNVENFATFETQFLIGETSVKQSQRPSERPALQKKFLENLQKLPLEITQEFVQLFSSSFGARGIFGVEDLLMKTEDGDFFTMNFQFTLSFHQTLRGISSLTIYDSRQGSTTSDIISRLNQGE